MNRDQIVVALAGVAGAIVIALQAFGVLSADQGVIVTGLIGTFLAGYRTDRSVAKDALSAAESAVGQIAAAHSAAAPSAEQAPETPNSP